MNWYIKYSQESRPLYDLLMKIRPQLAQAAQKVYDGWDASDPEYGDFEVGFGGICQDVAEALADVIRIETKAEAQTLESQCGEQHVWCIVYSDLEAYHVDIPYNIYEHGGGYNWKKIPDVVFDPSDISIWKEDIENIKEMTGDY